MKCLAIISILVFALSLSISNAEDFSVESLTNFNYTEFNNHQQIFPGINDRYWSEQCNSARERAGPKYNQGGGNLPQLDDLSWESIGPEGGGVWSIAQHSNNNNVVYATATGQVYKSTDFGNTWERIAVIPDYLVGISIDPVNPENIYISSGDNYYQSTDGGVTWDTHYFYTNYNCTILQKIFVDLLDSDKLYAAGNYRFGENFNSRYIIIFAKSEDQGNSWTIDSLTADGESGNVYSFAMDPSNPDILYICGSFRGDAPAPREYPIFKTVDGGNSWLNINLQGTIESSPSAFIVDPTNSNNLYAGNYGDVYRSTDGGDNWLPSSGGVHSYELLIDPLNTNIIYSGAIDTCYKSADYGYTWEAFPNGLRGAFREMLINQSNQILMGGSNCIYKSLDSGSNWIFSSNGIVATSVHSVAVAPSSTNILYAGILDNGFLKSIDYGQNWQVVRTAGYVWNYYRKIVVDPVDENHLYFHYNATVHESANGGENSNRIFDGADGWIEDISVYTSNFDVVWLTGNDISNSLNCHRSFDGGQTWNTVYPFPTSFGRGRVIEIDPIDSNIVYISASVSDSLSYTERIIRTTEGGNNWQTVWNDSSGNIAVYSIAIDPLSHNRVYAATDSGVYVSVDFGITWQEPTLAFGNYGCKVNLNPLSTNEIFVGCDDGIYFSDDYGVTWATVDTGIVINSISYFSFDPNLSDPIIYAGTNGGGIYKASLQQTEVRNIEYNVPTEITLNSNFPNPFNAATNIAFVLSTKTAIKLNIFNILGQQVVTLFEGEQEAGEHTITWDATVYPSGIYFYRIQAGNFAETRKMVLLK